MNCVSHGFSFIELSEVFYAILFQLSTSKEVVQLSPQNVTIRMRPSMFTLIYNGNCILLYSYISYI